MSALTPTSPSNPSNPESQQAKSPSTAPFGSLISWLEQNEQRHPQNFDGQQPAYVFLQPNETGSQQRFSEQHLSHRDLKLRAKSLAAHLQNTCATGDRAILLYPSGLDYIVAFFACLYAGIIAVPAFPPGARKRDWGRIDAIFSNANPAMVLTTKALSFDIETWQQNNNSQVNLVSTDEIGNEYASEWQQPQLNGDSIAFLQYSSGSTGTPKGVMVTHANIQHNMRVIGDGFSLTPEDRVCSWLPIYHDMGLIGSVLKPFDAGISSHLLSPMDVLQKPLRWLQAISDYRLTASGGPNFIYQHCVNRIKPEEIHDLDLRHWTLAYNGAEPISQQTLKQFANTFADCGFNAQALTPCYGMAETTLMVSSNTRNKPFNAPTDTIVSSGTIHPELTVKIVNPDTLTECAEAETGEIWVRGASVAAGYWQSEALTQTTFHAQLSPEQNREADQNNHYLRTGDLGFVQNGELHVTGRRKELIIIRGQNHYPQDIEATVANSCEPLQGCYGAAFSVLENGIEKLVVTHEINRTHMRHVDSEQLLAQVRQAVSANHQLHLHSLVIIKPASLLRTTSGKIRRVSMREAFLANELKTVFAWHADEMQTEALTETKTNKTTENAGATLETVQNETVQNKTVQTETVQDETVQDTLNWLRHYAEHRINSRLIDERRSIPPHIVLDMGNRGLMGLHVPKRDGGAGFSYQQAIQVYQQLGAIDPSLALFTGLGNVLGLRPLQHFGSATMKQQYLSNIASGRQLAAFAITEPGAGSNPLAMATTAIQNPNGTFTLSGSKIWSGTAAWASVIHVFAKTFDSKGNALGITGFCVERDLAGLHIGEEALTMGMRGTCQSRVELNGVVVPAHAVLGEIGQGMEVAQDAMKFGRLIITACAIGGMKRCAQLMLRYAQRRQIGTGLLLNNPITLQRLQDTHHRIHAVENLVQHIAALLDKGENVPIEFYAAAKISGPEYFWQTADHLVQMLGGRGYTENNIAPQLLRDARILRIFEGPTETLSMFLGARLHKTPDDYLQFVQQHFQDQNFQEQHVHEQNLTTQLQSSLRQLTQQVQQSNLFAQTLDANRWLHERSGQLTTLTTLQIALAASQAKNDNHQAVQQWLQHEFDTTFTQASVYLKNASASQAHKIGSNAYTQELVTRLQQFEQQIGNIEQQAKSEERHLDTLLLRDPNQPQANPAPQPIQSQSAQAQHESQPANTIDHSVTSWMQEWVARRLNLSAAQVSVSDDFATFGLDSVDAAELAQDLSTAFNVKVKADLAWVYPSIEQATQFLATAIAPSADSAQKPSVQEPSKQEQPQKEQPQNTQNKWLEGEI